MADHTGRWLPNWCFDMAVDYVDKILIKMKPEDIKAIQAKMEQAGVKNRSAYIVSAKKFGGLRYPAFYVNRYKGFLPIKYTPTTNVAGAP